MTPAPAITPGAQPSARAPHPLSRVRGRAGEEAVPGTAPAAPGLSPSLPAPGISPSLPAPGISPSLPAPGISPSLTLPRFAGEGIAARLGAAARLIEARS